MLLPRPRRFGKTFNLSILRYFLEKSPEDRRYLFNELNIEKDTEIMKKQGKYPLIQFMPYWVNTSENSIIKSLLASGSENLWSFLLLSGYLKVIDKRKDEEDETFIYTLKIPNKKIRILYKDIIRKWFKEGFVSNDFTNMLKALVIGEIELFEEYFSLYVLRSFSYFDISGENPERVYHAFILGMLVSLSTTHEIVFNRELGLGRYDVSLIPKDKSKIGIIMEFKSIRINSKMTLEEGLEKALNQVNKQFYDTELKALGVTNIIKLAFAFKGKEVVIKQG